MFVVGRRPLERKAPMAPDQVPRTPALSGALVRQLTLALTARTPGNIGQDVQDALDAMCTEAHDRGLPPEAMVLALRAAWSNVPVPLGTHPDEWSRSYYAAVGMCLSVYFGKGFDTTHEK
jgi:hypothetical protein